MTYIKLVLLAVISTCFVPIAMAQQGSTNAIPALEGRWVLDSVEWQSVNGTVTHSGNLPSAMYYTCPAKIVGTGTNRCQFHFENKEIKEVFYFIDNTDTGKSIRFSFQGKGSLPERQYQYSLETDETHLILTYSHSSDNYKYHYSFPQ